MTHNSWVSGGTYRAQMWIKPTGAFIQVVACTDFLELFWGGVENAARVSLSITGLAHHSGQGDPGRGKSMCKVTEAWKNTSHSENYKLCSSADTEGVGRWSGGRVCVCILEGHVLLLYRRWVGKEIIQKRPEELTIHSLKYIKHKCDLDCHLPPHPHTAMVPLPPGSPSWLLRAAPCSGVPLSHYCIEPTAVWGCPCLLVHPPSPWAPSWQRRPGLIPSASPAQGLAQRKSSGTSAGLAPAPWLPGRRSSPADRVMVLSFTR